MYSLLADGRSLEVSPWSGLWAQGLFFLLFASKLLRVGWLVLLCIPVMICCLITGPIETSQPNMT